MRTKQAIIADLNLEPHPEGGYFVRNYCSEEKVQTKFGERYATSNIHYLLADNDFSAWHRIQSDETWLYKEGSSELKIHMLDEKGNYSSVIIGPNNVHHTVKPGVWFAVELTNKNRYAYALSSCVVSPGFEFGDFEMADRERLTALYPEHSAVIDEFTRIAEAGAEITAESVEKKVDVIAMIAAMESEGHALAKHLGFEETEVGFPPQFGLRTFSGTVNDKQVFIVINGDDQFNKMPGIGSTEAVITASMVVTYLRPDIIISAGVAGGYADVGARIGDVYITQKAMFHDRKIPLESLAQFGQGLYPCLSLTGLRDKHGYKTGLATTGNTFMTPELRASLPLERRAHVEDMECAAIAEVVAKFPDVHMVAIKSVTNLTGVPAGEEEKQASDDFDANLKIANETLAAAVEHAVNYLAGMPLLELLDAEKKTLLVTNSVFTNEKAIQSSAVNHELGAKALAF